MALQRIGTCSLCGDDVYGYRGTWASPEPRPPDQCHHCHAVRRDDMIPMVPFRPSSMRAFYYQPPHPNKEMPYGGP